METLNRKTTRVISIGVAILAMLLLISGIPQLTLEKGVPFEQLWAFLVEELGANGLMGQPPAAGPTGGGEGLVKFMRVLFYILFICFPFAIIIIFLDPDLRKRVLRTTLYLVLLILALLLMVESQADEFELTDDTAGKELQGEEAELAEPITPEAFQSEETSSWITWAVSLGIGLLIALIIVAIVNTIRRNRIEETTPLDQLASRAEEAIAEIEAGGDLQDTILRCYAEMNRVVRAKRGIQRDRTVTAREFVDYLLKANLPSEPIYTLTRLFEQARYSTEQHSAEDQQTAVASLQAIANACRSIT